MTSLRWLQWSTIDLKGGMGGVEVHARNLGMELEKLGHSVTYSSHPRDLLSDGWDVVHTHGSAPASRQASTHAIRVHTLHGSTLERMAACGEWSWPGGYLAAFREWQGVQSADVVISIHEQVPLYKRAEQAGKVVGICRNGFDTADLAGAAHALGQNLRDKLSALGHYWVFVGRGQDRVKGVGRLKSCLPYLGDFHLVAAPGDGFEQCPDVLQTGPLSAAQVRELMRGASGLVLCSYYEGYPLVVLEALSLGLPVVTTRVGGLKTLPSSLQGLLFAQSGEPKDLAIAIQEAAKLNLNARETRAQENRKLLMSWAQVAQTYLSAIDEFKETRS